MTVINAMIFNNSQGAIIADEMGSSEMRKYTMFNKLHPFLFNATGVAAISSGAGNAEFVRRVLEETQANAKEGEITRGEHLVRLIGEQTLELQKEHIDNILKTTTNLTRNDIMTGSFMDEMGMVRRLEDTLQKEASAILMGQHETTKSIKMSNFLTLSYDSEGMKLHHNAAEIKTMPTKIYIPYGSIGSGADISDYVLTSFFNKMSRETRDKIDPLEGLVTLFQATDRAAEINHGVGGLYYVGLINKGEITIPTEDSTKLASEVALGYKKRYLSKEFTFSALNGLLYTNDNPEVWEVNMWKDAGKKKNELSRLLRGYRV